MRFERVLFLNCRELDFLQETTFSGLYKLLGEALHEYPRRRLYYEDSEYPRNIAFVKKARRGPSRCGLHRTDWDLIIVGSTKREPLDCYRTLLRRRPGLRSVPAVLIDGSDTARIGGERPAWFEAVERERPFDLIFKRELDRERLERRVFSLSFSINPDTFPHPAGAPEREHDLFFACRPTNAMRREVVESLRGRFERALLHLETKRLREPRLSRILKNISSRFRVRSYLRFGELDIPPSRYVRHMARSRIALSLPGAGFDTYRYWEIPAAGALLCSLRSTIYIRDNFEHGVSAWFFDDHRDVARVVEELLDDRNRIEEIAVRGKEHLFARHTDRVRAAFILNAIEDTVMRR